MKATKKLLAVMIALVMVLMIGLSACGSDDVEEDGQNPAMNYVGTYGCGRATVVIGAEGKDGMNAVITWASSAWENSSWTMSGTFDPDSLKFEYGNCVKTDYVYNEDGDVESETEAYTDGKGSMTFTEADPITLTWQDEVEDAGADMVFEFSGAIPGGGTGTANPWTEADTLGTAAEGAGLSDFSIAEGTEISLGAVEVSECRYMEGMAEAVVEFPAVEMTIRKGLTSAAAEEGDISGDYNTYDKEWSQNIKGLEVQCFGNREGDATKTIWQLDDVCYSITAYGLGGDTDYGLSADDLNELINSIQ